MTAIVNTDETIVRGKVPCFIIAEVVGTFPEFQKMQILRFAQDDSERAIAKWEEEGIRLSGRAKKKRVQDFACTLEREAATRS